MTALERKDKRMPRRRSSSPPLAGRVTVVAGATRGAGRGIARALGEAGAIVYCTGRSVRGKPSPYGRPETIDETAEMIGAAGGTAIAVQVDHAVEAEVEALFARVDREQGRVDILADSVGGENPLMGQYSWFWTTDLTNGPAVFHQSLLSHIITAKHAARLMTRDRRGLIVEVTENDALTPAATRWRQTVKFALKGLALTMAAGLHFPHNVAAVAVAGYLQSESMLAALRRDRGRWRDPTGKKDRNFLESETPLFVGRAVAALAANPGIMKRTGQLFSSWEVAREFKLTDADGRRPDWGSSPHQFLSYLQALLDRPPPRLGDSARVAGPAAEADEALPDEVAPGERVPVGLLRSWTSNSPAKSPSSPARAAASAAPSRRRSRRRACGFGGRALDRSARRSGGIASTECLVQAVDLRARRPRRPSSPRRSRVSARSTCWSTTPAPPCAATSSRLTDADWEDGFALKFFGAMRSAAPPGHTSRPAGAAS